MVLTGCSFTNELSKEEVRITPKATIKEESIEEAITKDEIVVVTSPVEDEIVETEETYEVEASVEQDNPIEPSGSDESYENMTYLGNFSAYAYCPCAICCGQWAGGNTASGTVPTEGRTIAVDTSIIPMGTTVYIDGYGYYVAEDTGSAINGYKIDVFHNSHDAALNWGIRDVDIYIVNEG